MDWRVELPKWAQQPTTSSGYYQPFEFGFEVLTTLKPDVVLGQPGMWQTIETDKPVYMFHRAKRNDASTIKRNVKLGTPMSFDYTSNEMDNVHVDNQIVISQVFQDFELAATNADYFGFRLSEAIMEVAREYERIAIDDLIEKGTQGTVKYFKNADGTESNEANVFETINEVVTQMVLNGSREENIAIFITPELWQKLYGKGIIMANGVGNIPATEVRNGFGGYILGFPVLKTPNLSTKWHTFKDGKETNMLIIDNSQVKLVRNMVEPVVMKRAPTDYPATCTFLTCFEYIKHYVVNENGVYYLNVVDKDQK